MAGKNKKKQKKRRGHLCVYCMRRLPNEQFSGKGHRTHICKKCQQKPKAERERQDAERFIEGLVQQSNISAGNIKTLTEMTTHEDQQIAASAAVLLRLAKVKPGKRRRGRFLLKHDPDLLGELQELFPWAFYSPLHPRDPDIDVPEDQWDFVEECRMEFEDGDREIPF